MPWVRTEVVLQCGQRLPRVLGRALSTIIAADRSIASMTTPDRCGKTLSNVDCTARILALASHRRKISDRALGAVDTLADAAERLRSLLRHFSCQAHGLTSG